MPDHQVGVFAVLDDGDKKVVLVTSRNGERWLFPKGQTEKGRPDRDVALDEAFEEAGLIGRISSKPFVFRINSSKGKHIHLYPMHVDKVLDDWPEKRSRKRQILSFRKAEKLLEKELRECLRTMSKRLAKRIHQDNQAFL